MRRAGVRRRRAVRGRAGRVRAGRLRRAARESYYLPLGDSLAQGVQAEPFGRAGDTDQGLGMDDGGRAACIPGCHGVAHVPTCSP